MNFNKHIIFMGFVSIFYFINFFAVSEFYFLRHGQTDFNSGKQKKYKDIYMNQQGIQEIESLKHVIQKLSIEVIYFSPLKRTVHTKNILNQELYVPEISLPEIKEIRTKFLLSKNKITKISQGLYKILADSRLALVVGHLNIYKAFCNILGVNTDIKKIDTGSLVHFYKNIDGDWTVNLISDVSRN